jgi:hypothetical protein
MGMNDLQPVVSKEAGETIHGSVEAARLKGENVDARFVALVMQPASGRDRKGDGMSAAVEVVGKCEGLHLESAPGSGKTRMQQS